MFSLVFLSIFPIFPIFPPTKSCLQSQRGSDLLTDKIQAIPTMKIIEIGRLCVVFIKNGKNDFCFELPGNLFCLFQSGVDFIKSVIVRTEDQFGIRIFLSQKRRNIREISRIETTDNAFLHRQKDTASRRISFTNEDMFRWSFEHKEVPGFLPVSQKAFFSVIVNELKRPKLAVNVGKRND